MGKRFIIIGGDAAGMSAATQIRRLKPDAEILAFEKGSTLSYAQCGLPYYIAGVVPEAKDLVARTPEQFREKYGIQVFIRHEVIKIDADERRVTVRALDEGSEEKFSYDTLLIATGGHAIFPNWEGRELNGVFPLKDIEDSYRIKKWLQAEMVEKVVIIGGGYIGLEMAEAFHLLKKEVTVLDLAPQLAGTFDPEMALLAKEELERNGIKVALEEEVTSFRGERGRVIGVETKRGFYPADLVLVAIGILPNSELAKEAGIELGIKGAIRVNERMETSMPGIYAAGDCATQYHRIKEQEDYIPLGTTANKQGRVAGTNMGGGEARFAGVVGSAIMKVLDMAMGRTGLSEKEAKGLGIPYEIVSIRSRDHAHYYPHAERLHLKLLYHRENRKLLGAQVVGRHGVDKRIDVLATALYHGMTIDQLQELDLSYAPPFNSVWDPVQQASTVARKI
ncbi:Coenzyme A disulfide reductase [[Clostridium] ultunense Esp]|uniref:CoA-disulfide reductase n=1 Tax=Thermicanus aegyptius TaxID=94009 RepID=UPI0002B6F317|nr:CoA-disulfide reductase [Thermicanus aegyptius]CCQ96303.1 Coenzyme A disulfide reductase [[Clostridium] ultunense Esp]